MTMVIDETTGASVLAMTLLLSLSACSDPPATTPDGDGDADGDADGDGDGDGCGDGECRGAETAATCPQECPAICGDGHCTHDESEESCVEDCRPTGASGYSRRELTAAGARRRVDFFAPDGRGASPPLVIALHGTGGPGDDPPSEWIDEPAESDPSGLEGLASAAGFIIAAPESRLWSEGGCPDWDNHDGWSGYYWETRCDTAPDRGADPEANEDLLLLLEIIDFAADSWGASRDRVYLIGFSNGGFFAIHAAMVLRDRIAAFAAMSAGLVTCDNTRSCTMESSATSCEAILEQAAAACSGCDGPDRPTAVDDSGRLVPGYLAHNNADDRVSVFYTCALADRMAATGFEVEVLIRDAQGHGFPEGAIAGAWSFLSSRSL